ncbi:MAG: hypothetical protein RDV41_09015 [Planctomycetota bacterium]|nr:hypothetical protein [Planctomycetota bacterium]
MKNRGDSQIGLLVALVALIFAGVAVYFLSMRRVDVRRTEARREMEAVREAELEKRAGYGGKTTAVELCDVPPPCAEAPSAPGSAPTGEDDGNVESVFSEMRGNLETDAPAGGPRSKLCESLKKTLSQDSKEKSTTEGFATGGEGLDGGRGAASDKIVVQLYVKKLNDAVLTQIKSAGAEVLLKSTAPDMVVARVEKEKLQKLSDIGEVWYIDFNFEHHDAIKKGELRGIDGEKVK